MEYYISIIKYFYKYDAMRIFVEPNLLKITKDELFIFDSYQLNSLQVKILPNVLLLHILFIYLFIYVKKCTL